MITKNVELKPFTADNIKLLRSWIVSPRQMFDWTFDNFDYPLDAAAYQRYLSFANYEGSRSKVYRVVVRESMQAIGHIELDNIDYVARSAILCRLLIGDSRYRGKGYSYEIVANLMYIVFEEFNFDTLTLNVLSTNTPAVKLYKKLGFVIEGTYSDPLIFEGKKVPYHSMIADLKTWKRITGKYTFFDKVI